MVQELMREINAIKPIKEENNRLILIPEETHGYTVRYFMDQASPKTYNRRFDDNIIYFAWQRKSPPRAELLVWFLIQGRINYGSYLVHFGLITSIRLSVAFVQAVLSP